MADRSDLQAYAERGILPACRRQCRPYRGRIIPGCRPLSNSDSFLCRKKEKKTRGPKTKPLRRLRRTVPLRSRTCPALQPTFMGRLNQRDQEPKYLFRSHRLGKENADIPDKTRLHNMKPFPRGRRLHHRGKEGHASDRKTYKPVVIRVEFDPDSYHEMNVAIVHSGDKIAVKVRPAGETGCKLYLTFDSSGTLETKAYLEWSTEPRRAPAALIRDGSRISLAGADDFGPCVAGKLNSRNGAVLKLGADCSAYRWQRFPMDDWGSCEVEIRIYKGNRWNIRPKSLL